MSQRLFNMTKFLVSILIIIINCTAAYIRIIGVAKNRVKKRKGKFGFVFLIQSYKLDNENSRTRATNILTNMFISWTFRAVLQINTWHDISWRSDKQMVRWCYHYYESQYCYCMPHYPSDIASASIGSDDNLVTYLIEPYCSPMVNTLFVIVESHELELRLSWDPMFRRRLPTNRLVYVAWWKVMVMV